MKRVGFRQSWRPALVVTSVLKTGRKMSGEQTALPKSDGPRLSIANRLRERLFGGAAGNVFRGMVVLATGSIAARAVGLLSIPVLTRIYGPEDFGVLAVFTALVAMLVPVLTLRYVMAVPLPRHDGMAMNIMVLSGALMIAMALVVGLMLWAFGPALLGAMSMDVLAPWWWLIVLGLVGTGTYEVLSMWATRRRAYKQIARTQFSQGLWGAAVKITLGLLALKPLGLLFGQIAAQSGGIGSLGRNFWREFRANARFVNMVRLRFAARRYRDFPVYRLPSQFLLVFSMQSPLLFTAMLYGAETAGQLGLAIMALTMPLALITDVTGKAYFAEIAKVGKRDPKTVHAITIDTMKKMTVMAVPVASVAFILGPWLFVFVFGEQWLLAGEFARILSVQLFFLIVARPVVQVMAVYDINRMYFIVNILRAFMILSVFLLSSYLSYASLDFVMLYSISMAAYYIFMLSLISYITKSRAVKE
jgi:O-antigen/teichoic acid export membrane protein